MFEEFTGRQLRMIMDSLHFANNRLGHGEYKEESTAMQRDINNELKRRLGEK